LITRGEVVWAEKWTPEGIAAGRRHEQDRREAYYAALSGNRLGVLQRFWRWLRCLFGW
jgi:hypothetical protein